MSSLRKVFHEIGNWHNKISIAAGFAKKVIEVPAPGLSDEEKLQEISQALSRIEGFTTKVDNRIIEVKEVIYANLNPDEERDL